MKTKRPVAVKLAASHRSWLRGSDRQQLDAAACPQLHTINMTMLMSRCLVRPLPQAARRFHGQALGVRDCVVRWVVPPMRGGWRHAKLGVPYFGSSGSHDGRQSHHPHHSPMAWLLYLTKLTTDVGRTPKRVLGAIEPSRSYPVTAGRLAVLGLDAHTVVGASNRTLAPALRAELETRLLMRLKLMPATVPSAPLPPAVAELAEQHELGALRATFKPQRYGWFVKSMLYVCLLSLFVIFVVPAVVCWYVWLRRMPDFNPRQAAKRLRLFEHGMIADEEAGTGTVAVRWDQMRLYEEKVQKIINGARFPTEYTCVAMGPQASVTVTNFYRGSGNWAPAMQKAVLRAQSAKVQRAYLAGDALDFGPFDLSTAGITHGKKLLPWSQLGEIQLSGGLAGAAVTVMKRGESAFWARTTPGNIPNLQLFLALVETYGKA